MRALGPARSPHGICLARGHSGVGPRRSYQLPGLLPVRRKVALHSLLRRAPCGRRGKLVVPRRIEHQQRVCVYVCVCLCLCVSLCAGQVWLSLCARVARGRGEYMCPWHNWGVVPCMLVPLPRTGGGGVALHDHVDTHSCIAPSRKSVSLCVSVCLFLCLSLLLSLRVDVYLFASMCVPVCLCVSLSVLACLSAYESVSLCLCHSVCLCASEYTHKTT
jgi:hypothetical protein